MTLPLFLAGVLPGVARESGERREPGPYLVSLLGFGGALARGRVGGRPQLGAGTAPDADLCGHSPPLPRSGLERQLEALIRVWPPKPARRARTGWVRRLLVFALARLRSFLLAFAQN